MNPVCFCYCTDKQRQIQTVDISRGEESGGERFIRNIQINIPVAAFQRREMALSDSPETICFILRAVEVDIAVESCFHLSGIISCAELCCY